MKRNSKLYVSNEEIMALHGLSGFGSVIGREEGSGGYATRSDAIEVVSGTGVTVDGQPLNEIWNEMQQRIGIFNGHAQAMLALLTFSVDRAQERVGVYANAAFEEATEFGRPNKIRLQYIRRAFPLEHHDLAYGFTQEFLDDARGSEIRSLAAKAEAAWNTLQMTVALEAVFNNVNGTDEDGLSIRRLYNADTEVPPSYRRDTHDGTHTHYLVGGATSFTAVNFATIEEHMVHHGYGDNGETLIIHVNRGDMVDVRAFTNFIPAQTSTVPVIIDGTVVGQTPVTTLPGGLQPQGWVGRLVVMQNDEIPEGYVFAHATGGLFADENVVGLRRHSNPGISGLRLIEGPVARYPLIDAVYDGYLGAGIRHRGAGVVMQATAGAYAVPTL